MFINIFSKVNFKKLNNRHTIFLLFFFAFTIANAQQIIKGTVVEKDSSSVLPFVYIINKSNGNGTMSDNNGRFTLATNENDTLICSYIGYIKKYQPVKDLARNSNGEVKLVLTQSAINLEVVNVTTFKIKPYEREYMNEIIDRSKITAMNYIESPITALYMNFSKEGKQIKKLAKIFEDIMIEEQVQKKLSPAILTRLTGDSSIDYEAFRKYCYYVNNYYIVSHDGVELYTRVMECYRRWKADQAVNKNQEQKYKAHD